VRDNTGLSHQNHATWIRDDRRPSCMPDTDNAEVRIRLTWETRRPYEKALTWSRQERCAVNKADIANPLELL
jgi:hypothetical protein